ncbi:MAG: serine/threonine protein kinase, partial [Pseudomonadota bacterium]
MSEAKAETKPDQAAAAGGGAPAGGSNAVVSIGGAYEVDPKKPLAALASPATKAFEARSKTDAKMQLFALVCQGPMPVRLGILQAMVGLDNPHMIKLAHSGIVVWPPDQLQRVVMLFQRPHGSRLTGADGRGEAWHHEQISQKLVAPMLGVLGDLEARKICHGAIRPDNIFAPRGLAEGIVLGECLTQPVGYHQPVLYETLQRGMANPAGRGQGMISDDLYALGVTMVTLLQGEPPLAGMSDEDILDRKLVQGSFYALVQKSRIPTNMLEPLRGLLNDDPAERWTLEDLESWLGGRRLSPRPPEPPRKAVRPFEFSGYEAWEARGLSRVLSRDPVTAHRLYEQGEVEAWMRRALGEKNI